MADDESPDPWDDPGWLEYAAHARDAVFPGLKGSAIAMAFVEGGELDPRWCCQLGAMVMLDKPILAVVVPGVKVPDKLIRIADEIVEGMNMKDEDFQERLMAAIKRMQAKFNA